MELDLYMNKVLHKSNYLFNEKFVSDVTSIMQDSTNSHENLIRNNTDLNQNIEKIAKELENLRPHLRRHRNEPAKHSWPETESEHGGIRVNEHADEALRHLKKFELQNAKLAELQKKMADLEKTLADKDSKIYQLETNLNLLINDHEKPHHLQKSNDEKNLTSHDHLRLMEKEQLLDTLSDFDKEIQNLRKENCLLRNQQLKTETMALSEKFEMSTASNQAETFLNGTNSQNDTKTKMELENSGSKFSELKLREELETMKRNYDGQKLKIGRVKEFVLSYQKEKEREIQLLRKQMQNMISLGIDVKPNGAENRPQTLFHTDKIVQTGDRVVPETGTIDERTRIKSLNTHLLGESDNWPVVGSPSGNASIHQNNNITTSVAATPSSSSNFIQSGYQNLTKSPISSTPVDVISSAFDKRNEKSYEAQGVDARSETGLSIVNEDEIIKKSVGFNDQKQPENYAALEELISITKSTTEEMKDILLENQRSQKILQSNSSSDDANLEKELNDQSKTLNSLDTKMNNVLDLIRALKLNDHNNMNKSISELPFQASSTKTDEKATKIAAKRVKQRVTEYFYEDPSYQNFLQKTRSIQNASEKAIVNVQHQGTQYNLPEALKIKEETPDKNKTSIDQEKTYSRNFRDSFDVGIMYRSVDENTDGDRVSLNMTNRSLNALNNSLRSSQSDIGVMFSPSQHKLVNAEKSGLTPLADRSGKNLESFNNPSSNAIPMPAERKPSFSKIPVLDTSGKSPIRRTNQIADVKLKTEKFGVNEGNNVDNVKKSNCLSRIPVKSGGTAPSVKDIVGTASNTNDDGDFEANVVMGFKESSEPPSKPENMSGQNEESDDWADTSLNNVFIKQLEQALPDENDAGENVQIVAREKDPGNNLNGAERNASYGNESIYDLECSYEKLYNKGYTPRINKADGTLENQTRPGKFDTNTDEDNTSFGNDDDSMSSAEPRLDIIERVNQLEMANAKQMEAVSSHSNCTSFNDDHSLWPTDVFVDDVLLNLPDQQMNLTSGYNLIHFSDSKN